MSGGIEAGQAGHGVSGVVPRHLLAALGAAPGHQAAPIVACRTCDTAVDKKVFALTCRTCGELLVRTSELTERARPDALVPFAIDENTARAAFATWVSSRRFAPRTLRDIRHPRSVDGVFLPFWCFSTRTTSQYIGERGETKHRQVQRTRTNANGNSETYWESESYTKWYDVAGEIHRSFDSLVVPGCSPLAEKIPDWPMNAAVPFTPNAGDGKRVIAYDVEPEAGFEAARRSMTDQIELDARDDIGGDHQRVHDVRTRYIDPAYTLFLVPAWLVSYTHEKRSWSALINGSTGEVAGNRPYSPAKIVSMVAGLAVAVAVAVLLLAHLGR